VRSRSYQQMALIGRLHPLLIHFPIAFVIAAAAAEAASVLAADDGWRTVARRSVRAGAVFGVLAAIAGWRLALAPGMEPSPLLAWHRSVGTIAAGVTFAAALMTAGAGSRSARAVWVYRMALFAAGLLVAVTGHLGGLLVWGADFLRP
jgi:uncharacterized membrane protein